MSSLYGILLHITILFINFFSRAPRPIVVELSEQYDDEDGLPEKLAQKNPSYQK